MQYLSKILFQSISIYLSLFFISSKEIYASSDPLKKINKTLIIQNTHISSDFLLYTFPHFYPIFEFSKTLNNIYLPPVEAITNMINMNVSRILRSYDSSKLEDLKPYFPTSFVKIANSPSNPNNARRFLTPEEIKKLTIYNNSAFIFFLTGEESDSIVDLLDAVAGEANTFDLKEQIEDNKKYNYPFICVIMTDMAETKYANKDNSLCSRGKIFMRELNKNYDVNNKTVQTNTQTAIINLIKSYNTPTLTENTYLSTTKTLTLYPSRNKNFEILTLEEYSTKILQELKITQK